MSLSSGSTQVAYYDTKLHSYGTIRCTMCQILIPSEGVIGRRCKECNEYRKTLHAKVKRLQTRLQREIEERGVVVDSDLHKDLNTIVKESSG